MASGCGAREAGDWLMLVFAVHAFVSDDGDGYDLKVHVPDGVPTDIVYKVAKEVGGMIEDAPVSYVEDEED